MNTPLHRRVFLRCAMTAPLLGASGVSTMRCSVGAAEPIRRVGGPRLKVSLNAYSFSRALLDNLQDSKAGLSLFDLLDFCAEHDFDAVDPTGYFFPGYPAPPSDEYVNNFKRRAFELGLDISGTGVRNDFATPDETIRAEGVRHAKEWVEVASKLGAPVLRVFAGKPPEGHDWEKVARWMAADLRAVADHGKRFGVLVGVQNHGDMLKTADETIKVVDMVNSDWFGVIVDTGYFKTPDPYDDIARVMPYAVNMQVKESPFGKGSSVRTDVARLLRIVRESGYRGYLPLETLATAKQPYDPKARVPAFLAEVRSEIAKIETGS